MASSRLNRITVGKVAASMAVVAAGQAGVMMNAQSHHLRGQVVMHAVRYFLVVYVFAALLTLLTGQERLAKVGAWLTRHRTTVVKTSFAVYVSMFSLFSFLRHLSYGSHFYDLAVLVQPLYNTGHGRFLEMTFPDLVNRSRFAGGSVEMILVPIAALYDIAPHPFTLFLLQALALGATILVFDRICQHLAPDNGILLLVALAMIFFCTPLHFLGVFDFHVYAFVPLAASLLVLGYLKSNLALYWLGFVFIVMIRNDLAIYSIPLAILWAMRRRWQLSLITLVVGLGYYAWVVAWFSPLFGEVPQSFDKYVHHGFLGSSASEIFLNIVLHPMKTLQYTFSSAAKTMNFFALLWVTAFIPVFVGFEGVLLAGPFFLLYFLPPSEIFTIPYHQYDASMTPFVLIATLIGVVRLERAAGALPDWSSARFGRRLAILRHFPSLAVLSSCLLAFAPFGSQFNNVYKHVATDIVGRYIALWSHYQSTDEMVAFVRANVPSDASLAAVSSLAPHVAHREFLLVAHEHLEDAEWAFIDLMPGVSKVMPEEELRSRVLAMLGNASFAPVRYVDGIVLLRRASNATSEQRADCERVKNELSDFLARHPIAATPDR